MHKNPDTVFLLRRIRLVLAGFVLGLMLSGLTAFPLTWELKLLARWLGANETATPEQFSGFTEWIVRVRNALVATDASYPFLAYGYNWLAFAHLMIGLAFIGPYRDPVRNVWIIEWAMLCCIAVFPLAFLCGPIRGIPFYWQLIDCSFGAVGLLPLWWLKRAITALANHESSGAVASPFAQKKAAGQAG